MGKVKGKKKDEKAGMLKRNPIKKTGPGPRHVWPFLQDIRHPESSSRSSLIEVDSGALQFNFLKLYIKLKHKPESFAFKSPVDPKALGIPNYFKVVKKPMDLATIGGKLEGGDYSNPWGFVEDLWLMLQNAWLFNGKCSTVHKHATKLAEFMEPELKSAMKEAGYCCAKKYSFDPKSRRCWLKEGCEIEVNQSYFVCEEKYSICDRCFRKNEGETVILQIQSKNEMENDPELPLHLPKNLFEKRKNDESEPELFLNCSSGCGRIIHQICALHLDPSSFICESCLKMRNGQLPKDFGAVNLPETELSKFVENFLKAKIHLGEVPTIRILSSGPKLLKLRSEMENRFAKTGEMAVTFPYREKVLFAFQTLEGVEVLLFVMHAQEYGSDCPEPNSRRVYVSYLDSVNYFQPKELRTELYHQIILGYLEFVKRRGFQTAHIWASPSPPGKDYIIHRHPPEQKIPSAQRLIGWYKELLNKGVAAGILESFNSLWDDECIRSPVKMPYFDGDFWPDFFETEIEKSKGKATPPNLSTKMLETMKKNKDEFFLIHLIPRASAPLKNTEDRDPILECKLLDRETFLAMERKHNFEFSTLRRAKFSTKAIVFEIAKQLGLVSGSYDGGVAGSSTQSFPGREKGGGSQSAMDAYTQVFSEEYVTNLTHAFHCEDADCRELPSCLEFKRILTHTRVCGDRDKCMVCKKLLSFVKKHGESCVQGETCVVPYCFRIKQKLVQLRRQENENEGRREPHQEAAPAPGWEVGLAKHMKHILRTTSGNNEAVIELLRRGPPSLLSAFRAP